MAKNATGYFGLRMSPEEIADVESRAKAVGMTRSAWAKRCLLSSETAGAGAAEIEREFVATRDLIREKNKNLVEVVRRELVAELGNQSLAIGEALKVVAAAVKNAGDRAR